jgi:hypothetical protein
MLGSFSRSLIAHSISLRAISTPLVCPRLVPASLHTTLRYFPQASQPMDYARMFFPSNMFRVRCDSPHPLPIEQVGGRRAIHTEARGTIVGPNGRCFLPDVTKSGS